jgi:hypothetical protein
MVKNVLRLGLALAALWASPAALRLEPVPLAPLAPRPEPPAMQPSAAWEDVSAVTLVSLPFTAFWCLLGSLAVAGVAQHKFPPDMDTPTLLGAATVAAGASLAIGLVSLQWGGPSSSAR